MVRMRTINQAIREIKQVDPGSCVSEWWLRKLVKSGNLKSHRAGNKFLLDMDYLDEYLKNPPTTDKPELQTGILRRVQ
ncbi:MAG TPA: DNA-binding protein [Desulfotomaculum sp.]|nr:MAG: Uncharacterized protein XD84_1967 [Desulfotomaculum sp. 46_80]HAG12062.1 DNA-binding protein [Desulfotomaculum sp.]HBY04204.1 DNA-binding protein [Desulfotomaculum sp.]